MMLTLVIELTAASPVDVDGSGRYAEEGVGSDGLFEVSYLVGRIMCTDRPFMQDQAGQPSHPGIV